MWKLENVRTCVKTWQFMKMNENLLKCKMISNLELHPVFPLMVNGVKIGRYTADFKYINDEGKTIIEDVKSKVTKTRDYILRKKILATYNPPILIKEII